MTTNSQDLLRRACLAISPDRVTYLPGSWAKRFGRAMADRSQAEDFDSDLTEKQTSCIWAQVYRYRRQIREKDLVEHAAKVLGIPPERHPRVTHLGRLQGMSR